MVVIDSLILFVNGIDITGVVDQFYASIGCCKKTFMHVYEVVIIIHVGRMHGGF